MNSIIQSTDPDIDILKCTKCGAIWRAKGHYNYDKGGWNYYNDENGVDEELCPTGCIYFFRFRIKGKVI